MAKRKKKSKLKKTLQGLKRDKLDHALDKTERINIRVSKADKESLHRMAKKLGMTLTEYVMQIHRTVANRFR